MKKRGFSRLLVLMLAIAMLWMSVIPAYADVESDLRELQNYVDSLEKIINELDHEVNSWNKEINNLI